MANTFKALLVSRGEDKTQSAEFVDLRPEDLMEGDVDIAVEATTVNYKDGLAVTGKGPIVRRWPMIPGIDLAGTVIASSHPGWREGDKVVLNGWGVGESHYGGYAARARVSGDWLVPLPEGFSMSDAMAVGTAGFTAMLCVMALEAAGITPERGPIVVTGASGGVGSVAIAVLAKLGWDVVAVTGRPDGAAYLKDLGAAEIVDRRDLSGPAKPLGPQRWAAGIDTAGSHTLANVLASTMAEGAVACCGNAQGLDLPASVAPFILRGVSLHGIDAPRTPMPKRSETWRRLGQDLDPGKLKAITTEIAFDDIPEAAQRITEGQIRGRLVVTMG
ncbi:MDR family oxidoreductase [Consotaella aegiceratis]|uniref:acrylyl-CoA reductase (NADPH) n=1 Tax=Consotaella aegiceratis TaxID=3097961 RepID=UPI002F409FD4